MIQYILVGLMFRSVVILCFFACGWLTFVVVSEEISWFYCLISCLIHLFLLCALGILFIEQTNLQPAYHDHSL